LEKRNAGVGILGKVVRQRDHRKLRIGEGEGGKKRGSKGNSSSLIRSPEKAERKQRGGGGRMGEKFCAGKRRGAQLLQNSWGNLYTGGSYERDAGVLRREEPRGEKRKRIGKLTSARREKEGCGCRYTTNVALGITGGKSSEEKGSYKKNRSCAKL